MVYVIEEDLMVIGQERMIPTRDFTPYKAAKSRCNVTLASQHIGPLFSGPLDISIKFYFPSKSKKGMYISKPNIAVMSKFIIDAGVGVILDDDYSVVSLNCVKMYDNKSRIEMVVNMYAG